MPVSMMHRDTGESDDGVARQTVGDICKNRSALVVRVLHYDWLTDPEGG